VAANSRLTIAVHGPALGAVYGGVEQAMRHELGRTSIADVLHQTLRL
jgi:hypothetical protein